MTPRWDVIGFGIVAVDDVLVVDRFPTADEKMPVLSRSRHGGGLAGTALVAAARLGARCAYAGVLGDDELSRWTIENLERAGVDCSMVIRRADARPFHADIIVENEGHTRTILYSREGVTPRDVESIDEPFVSQTRVLLLDYLGIDAQLAAARLARRLGVATVGDIERDDDPKTGALIEATEHLIVPAAFALKLTGCAEPDAAVRALAETGPRACTAVTCGNDGCWYRSPSDSPTRHQPAFGVEVVDSTGCGDVLHGAYAASLALGWEVDRAMRFASAAAALNATRQGGQAGVPAREDVESLLKG